jgi:hypothetical protein
LLGDGLRRGANDRGLRRKTTVELVEITSITRGTAVASLQAHIRAARFPAPAARFLTATLWEEFGAIPSGCGQTAAVAVTGRTDPASAAAGIEAAILGAAFTRSVDIALGVQVLTPVAVAFALIVVGMLLQVLLDLLRA